MTKPLDSDAIARAMHEAARIAKHGSPEQRAGRFKPEPANPAPEPKQGKAHA
ncbi:hypothetical protein [Caulobacter soli]|uniref:hypothetical protein n=1 Tax=Caulobacter soli TaxID=2708539 RepID=UPI0013EC71C3|nr:hypothetical protein [Caulobacter soli]